MSDALARTWSAAFLGGEALELGMLDQAVCGGEIKCLRVSHSQNSQDIFVNFFRLQDGHTILSYNRD